MVLKNRTESAALNLTLENFKCVPEPGLHDMWMKRVESDKINNPVPEGETGQGADYEYYDDTELNGKLFYTDVRDLLNCTKTASKLEAVPITLKPPSHGGDNGVNTKVTAKPMHTTTIVTKQREPGLNAARVSDAVKTEDEVVNQINKENKPNVYTTSRLATVSAKPLGRSHFEENMASDEAKADNIKAHRSIQDKNDDYNDLFNNSGSFFIGSFKTVVFVTLLNIRFLFY